MLVNGGDPRSTRASHTSTPTRVKAGDRQSVNVGESSRQIYSFYQLSPTAAMPPCSETLKV